MPPIPPDQTGIQGKWGPFPEPIVNPGGAVTKIIPGVGIVVAPGSGTGNVTISLDSASVVLAYLGIQPSNDVAITGGTITGTTITFPGIPNGIANVTGGGLGTYTNLGWDDTNKQLAAGILAVGSVQFGAQFKRDRNGGQLVYVENPNAGTAAYCGLALGQSDAATGVNAGVVLYGAGFTPSGPFVPGALEIAVQGGGTGPMLFDVAQAVGDFVWNSQVAYVETMRLVNTGAATNPGALVLPSSAKVLVGSTTPSALAQALFHRSVNGGQMVHVVNPSAGGAAFMGFLAGSTDNLAGALGGFLLYGTGFTPSGPFVPGAYEMAVQGGTGPMLFDIPQVSGDFVWNTGAGYTERMRLTHAGLLTLGAGNYVYGAAPIAAGAQVVALNNAPAAVVSTTPKWESYKDSGGVTSYRMFLQ